MPRRRPAPAPAGAKRPPSHVTKAVALVKRDHTTLPVVHRWVRARTHRPPAQGGVHPATPHGWHGAPRALHPSWAYPRGITPPPIPAKPPKVSRAPARTLRPSGGRSRGPTAEGAKPQAVGFSARLPMPNPDAPARRVSAAHPPPAGRVRAKISSYRRNPAAPAFLTGSP